MKTAKDEFSLGLEDDVDHQLDLSFQSPRDIAAPQVCTSLHKLLEHLVYFDSVFSRFELAVAPYLALRYTETGEEDHPPARYLHVWTFFFFFSLSFPY